MSFAIIVVYFQTLKVILYSSEIRLQSVEMFLRYDKRLDYIDVTIYILGILFIMRRAYDGRHIRKVSKNYKQKFYRYKR